MLTILGIAAVFAAIDLVDWTLHGALGREAVLARAERFGADFCAAAKTGKLKRGFPIGHFGARHNEGYFATYCNWWAKLAAYKGGVRGVALVAIERGLSPADPYVAFDLDFDLLENLVWNNLFSDGWVDPLALRITAVSVWPNCYTGSYCGGGLREVETYRGPGCDGAGPCRPPPGPIENLFAD